MESLPLRVESVGVVHAAEEGVETRIVKMFEEFQVCRRVTSGSFSQCYHSRIPDFGFLPVGCPVRGGGGPRRGSFFVGTGADVVYPPTLGAGTDDPMVPTKTRITSWVHTFLLWSETSVYHGPSLEPGRRLHAP